MVVTIWRIVGIAGTWHCTMTLLATQPESAAWQFDLDGGALCLNLVNTLSPSSGDHLTSCDDLIEFAHQSALLTRSQAERLHADAARYPKAGADVLKRAKRLRTALFGVFTAVAAGEAAPSGDLDLLNREIGASLRHARLRQDPDGTFSWTWSGEGLDSLVWPIVQSATDVLTSEALRPLVRECGAGDCHWLFLDTTKNRSRQWCSMQSCGNREKARRHYQRQKQRRSA